MKLRAAATLMVTRRGGTTAVCRRRPRWHKYKLRRASTSYGLPGAINGHGWTQWVAGVAVKLQWDGGMARASCRRQGRWRTLYAGTAAAAGEKETEAKQMGCVAKCGWVRAMLRHALPWLGHTRRGSGDARRSLATTRRLGSEPVGH